MKRIICWTCVATLFILGAGAVCAAPRLVIPETTFNFGYAPQNAKITHEFWLKSSGDDTLKILKVTPG